MPKIEITLPAGRNPLASVQLKALARDCVTVESVTAGSDASSIVLAGDRLITVNGVPIVDAGASIELLVKPMTTESLRLQVSRRSSADEHLLESIVASTKDRHFASLAASEASRLSLTYSHSFGCYGLAPEQFSMPCNVLALPDGDFVVADGGGCRLQVLSPQGELRRIIGCRGENVGQFNYPAGLALDSDAVIVVDRGNCRLQRCRDENRAGDRKGGCRCRCALHEGRCKSL